MDWLDWLLFSNHKIKRIIDRLYLETRKFGSLVNRIFRKNSKIQKGKKNKTDKGRTKPGGRHDWFVGQPNIREKIQNINKIEDD